MVETIFCWEVQGIIVIPGFLGGAKWISSIHRMLVGERGLFGSIDKESFAKLTCLAGATPAENEKWNAS